MGTSQQLRERLQRALAGSGPPLMPESLADCRPEKQLPGDLAMIVGTSGSTGAPKYTLLSRAAVTASANATHERLGGPGTWLLALPATHIAGLQVIARSVIADTPLGTLDLAAPFTAPSFASAAASHLAANPGVPAYLSLVPTQLARILPDPGARELLARFASVLIGGAAAPPELLARGRSAGVPLITTYGMSETCGGCVYDGLPLTGVQALAEPDGRIRLAGPVLASGYLGRPDLTAAAFVSDTGKRWFRTDDVGHLDAAGRLWVAGRLDDVIITGGLKVTPRLVEQAILAAFTEVSEVCVVGLPDPHWGQRVGVLLAPATALEVTEVRNRLRGALPSHALPAVVASTAGLPLLGPGKPDRAMVVRQLTRRL